jgi:hypothetical protein
MDVPPDLRRGEPTRHFGAYSLRFEARAFAFGDSRREATGRTMTRRC